MVNKSLYLGKSNVAKIVTKFLLGMRMLNIERHIPNHLLGKFLFIFTLGGKVRFSNLLI